MSQNKKALIRYRTIDKCLQNHYKQWTIDDLIQQCSDTLFELEGREISLSKRTIQLDIQMMRSDKLGYNAPIEVYDKKYYRYANANFSITNIPVTANDLNILSESIEVLKQFKDFSLFEELNGVLNKLEDKIYTEKHQTNSVIHIETNDLLKGIHYINDIYQAILKKTCLTLQYKSFKADEPSTFLFHPYFLKEYNNRWFVFGKRENHEGIVNLALDRIESLQFDFHTHYINNTIQTDTYFEHTIGVSVLNTNPEKVVLHIDAKNAPYILTKPFHSSQEVIQKLKNGSVTVALHVQLNYELERLILGFGSSIEVIEPKLLRTKIKRITKKSFENYYKKAQP